MKRGGFSLIELIIVIALIAILAGAMVPLFRTSRLEAQQAKVAAELDALKSAAMMFHNDTGAWPPGAAAPGRQDGSGFITNTNPATANWNGPYLDAWRADPWGNNYRLIEVTAGGITNLSVVTYGADNAAGGAGANADITLLITADRSR
jgi:general secretion pathway protein G